MKHDTPLFDLNDFDVIWDVPIEEFHLCKEGITKLMMDRMFNSAAEATVRLLGQFSRMYCRLQVFSETSRRTREIKLKQLKGSSNLLVFRHVSY